MRLLFNIKNQEILEIQLTKGKLNIDKTHLTISQGFDTMLIRTLDKIFRKNRIDRLSLKSVEIRGEMAPNALSGMILQTVARTLTI